MHWGIGVLLGLLVGAPVKAQDLTVFDPASDWVLDYAEDSCALRRAFADDQGRGINFELSQHSLGEGGEFTIFGSDIAANDELPRYRIEPQGSIADGFLPGQVMFPNGAKGVRFGGQLTIFDDPSAAPFLVDLDARREREAAITGLSVLSGFAESFTLRVGSMAAPMDAMRTCAVDLLGAWGLDVAAYRSIVEAPQRRSFGRWATRIVNAYPRSMLKSGLSAQVTVRVLVDEEGRVNKCAVLHNSSRDEFGSAACEGMVTHGRYEPARDTAGQAVNSLDTLTVFYPPRR